MIHHFHTRGGGVMIIDRLVLKIQNAILNSKTNVHLDILKQKEYLESFEILLV